MKKVMSKTDKANIIYKMINKKCKELDLEFTMSREDGGYEIFVDMENEIDSIEITDIEWHYDEIDTELKRDLPSEIEIEYTEITDWLNDDGYDGDVNDIKSVITQFLNYENMTEPKSFNYEIIK
jgi:hypothetical protein